MNIFTSTMPKQALTSGKTLIASPFLHEPYFERATILLTEFETEGAMGFIVNKQSDSYVSEVVDDLNDCDIPIFLGGPVAEDRLHYIHTLGDQIPNSIKVMDGVYWGGDFDVVKMLINQKKISGADIKFFLGYTGWGSDQLKEEVKDESWVVSQLNLNSIMEEKGEELWKMSLQKMGDVYTLWSTFPIDPTLN